MPTKKKNNNSSTDNCVLHCNFDPEVSSKIECASLQLMPWQCSLQRFFHTLNKQSPKIHNNNHHVQSTHIPRTLVTHAHSYFRARVHVCVYVRLPGCSVTAFVRVVRVGDLHVYICSVVISVHDRNTCINIKAEVKAYMYMRIHDCKSTTYTFIRVYMKTHARTRLSYIFMNRLHLFPTTIHPRKISNYKIKRIVKQRATSPPSTPI